MPSSHAQNVRFRDGRVETFQTVVNAAVMDTSFSCDFGDAPVEGVIRHKTYPSVSVGTIESVGHRARRRRPGVTASASPFLVVQMEGESCCSNGQGTWTLHRGDVGLLDARCEIDLDFPSDQKMVVLRMVEDARLDQIVHLHRGGLVLRATTAAGHLVSDFLTGLVAEIDRLSEAAQRDILGASAALLRTAFHESAERAIGASPTGMDVQLRTVKELIARNLAEPGLSIQWIAREAKLSTRYIGMLFEACGVSPLRYIWNERLERCRADLADPRLSALTLTEIAHGWGFKCSAHFSRSFRARYGMSPSAYRSSV